MTCTPLDDDKYNDITCWYGWHDWFDYPKRISCILSCISFIIFLVKKWSSHLDPSRVFIDHPYYYYDFWLFVLGPSLSLWIIDCPHWIMCKTPLDPLSMVFYGLIDWLDQITWWIDPLNVVFPSHLTQLNHPLRYPVYPEEKKRAASQPVVIFPFNITTWCF